MPAPAVGRGRGDHGQQQQQEEEEEEPGQQPKRLKRKKKKKKLKLKRLGHRHISTSSPTVSHEVVNSSDNNPIAINAGDTTSTTNKKRKRSPSPTTAAAASATTIAAPAKAEEAATTATGGGGDSTNRNGAVGGGGDGGSQQPQHQQQILKKNKNKKLKDASAEAAAAAAAAAGDDNNNNNNNNGGVIRKKKKKKKMLGTAGDGSWASNSGEVVGGLSQSQQQQVEVLKKKKKKKKLKKNQNTDDTTASTPPADTAAASASEAKKRKRSPTGPSTTSIAGSTAKVIGASNIRNNDADNGDGQQNLKKKKKKKIPGSAATTVPTKAQATAVVPTPAASSSSHTHPNNSKKNLKRPSPFRIKVGCVVALRVREEGNDFAVIPANNNTTNNDDDKKGAAPFSAPAAPVWSSPEAYNLHTNGPDSFCSVWTSPVPGRDEGLALIGKRVRCSLPQSMLPKQQSQKQQQKKKKQQPRVIEGEVIRLLDYEDYRNCSKDDGARWMTGKKIYRAELLVDKTILERHFPFLMPRAVSSAGGTEGGESKAEKRKMRLEETIRGKDKSTIYLNLADPVTLSTTKSPTHLSPKADGILWAIQKLIPTKLFFHQHQQSTAEAGTSPTSLGREAGGQQGKINNNGEIAGKNKTNIGMGANKNKLKSDSAKAGTGNTNKKPQQQRRSPVPDKKSNDGGLIVRHVGDGKDSPDQQISNWRWLTTHYHDLYLFHNNATATTHSPEMLSMGFVGEVLKVDVSSSAFKNTLATVTLRRLVLPEHTATGRLPHHGPLDVFDVCEDSSRNKSANKGEAVVVKYHIQLPIEQLVIVGRKTIRNDDEGGAAGEATAPSTLDCLNLQRSYSLKDDLHIPLRQQQLHPKRKAAEQASSTDGPNNITSTTNVEGATTTTTTSTSTLHCHRCRRVFIDEEDSGNIRRCLSDWCPLSFPGSASCCWCRQCLQTLTSHNNTKFDFQVSHSDEETMSQPLQLLPCCLGGGVCDCRRCQSYAGMELYDDLCGTVATAVAEKKAEDSVGEHHGSGKSGGNSFAQATAVLRHHNRLDTTTVVDFGLPMNEFLNPSLLPKPLAQPSVRTKTKIKARSSSGTAASMTRTSPYRLTVRTPPPGKHPRASSLTSTTVERRVVPAPAVNNNAVPEKKKGEDYTVFKPTCARHLTYTESRKHIHSNNYDSSSILEDRPRNVRIEMLQEDDKKKAELAEKTERTSSRAARANQRRLMKDVAAIGLSSSLVGVDALSNREPQLRFGRSGIHAWGVYADEDIPAETMVIEYRGELIGNAEAEKRAEQYVAEKLGSDYMFTIDGNQVCDATKLGNVARFINACCEPNCYTKIITLEGNKRIVIYSKRDIKAGEELCYDYKFGFEFDPAKRIPCHCGAENCRGFMNWDKKYIALEDSPDGKCASTAKSLKTTTTPALPPPPLFSADDDQEEQEEAVVPTSPPIEPAALPSPLLAPSASTEDDDDHDEKKHSDSSSFHSAHNKSAFSNSNDSSMVKQQQQQLLSPLVAQPQQLQPPPPPPSLSDINDNDNYDDDDSMMMIPAKKIRFKSCGTTTDDSLHDSLIDD